MEKREKWVVHFTYFTLAALWMELIYQGFTYGELTWHVAFQFLFSMGIAAVFTMVCGLFAKKANKVLTYICSILLFLFYGTQLVYQSLFKVPLLWGVAEGAAEDATAYWKEGLEQIVKNLPALLLMVLPIIVLIVLNRKVLTYERRSWKLSGILLLLSVFLYFLPVGLIELGGKESTAYVNYYEMNDQVVAAKTLGIWTTFRRDLQGVGSVGMICPNCCR